MASKLGRRKDILALRKRITKQLGVNAIFGGASTEHEQILEAVAQFGQLKRVDHEQQLEAIKNLLHTYIFDPSVVVRGTEEGKDGLPRVVELSYFDRMMKATRLYLDTMNLQNKMWGLYTVPEATAQLPTGTLSIRAVSVGMVEELQRLAKKGNPQLKDSEPRTTDNGTPDP